MVSALVKVSARLRMNYNFHQLLEDKCHRMLNAVEPGTQVPIHRHPKKDESFVILRGKHWMNKHALSSFVSWLLTLVRCLENVLFENENQYAWKDSTLAMVAK